MTGRRVHRTMEMIPALPWYHSGRNAYILNSKKYVYVRLLFAYSKFGSEK